uniref:hypothetical protein n=1 Tax=Nocardioides stalactiti TaxID=2755356 RepID=UPI001C7E2A80
MAAPRTTRTAATLAVGVLLSLGACTGEEDPGDRETGVAVPALEEAWRVPLPDGDVWHDLDDARGDGLWPAADAVSVVAGDSVTTYDALTGVVRSTVDLDGEVCGVSRDLNPAGVGVVVLGPLEDCRTVVAVDTVAGQVRWKARLRRPVVVNAVPAGDRAVAVTDVFVGAQRLRLSDGSPLPTLGRGEAASDGTLVVVTPEGGGDRESYDVYDQDTGRLLRSLPAPPSTRVETLVSSDPLVVTASSYDDDGTFLRDLSGDRAVRFGRRTSAGYPRLAEHVAGSDLVAVQYGGSPLVATW